MHRVWRECFGEFIGTFVLVFIGCAAVGMATVLGWLTSLWQVAAIWGIGVTLAIMISHRFSPSHLNPAVTLAMCIGKGHSWRRLLPYSIAQFIGAIVAARTLLFLFTPAIDRYETRLLGRDADLYQFVGPLRSSETAQMFGEFFPNQGYAHLIDIHWSIAMGLEALGAFLMLYFIFRFTDHIHQLTWKTAAQIGLVVALIICIIAPFTQCGINPARDLGPRIIAYFNGYGVDAITRPHHASITVYVIGPILGAMLAALEWRRDKPALH